MSLSEVSPVSTSRNSVQKPFWSIYLLALLWFWSWWFCWCTKNSCCNYWVLEFYRKISHSEEWGDDCASKDLISMRCRVRNCCFRFRGTTSSRHGPVRFFESYTPSHILMSFKVYWFDGGWTGCSAFRTFVFRDLTEGYNLVRTITNSTL